MTEEIKEKLDLFKYCVEKNEYLEVANMKEWKPLLNYITNLQKENEVNKTYYDFYKDMSDKWKNLSDVYKKNYKDYKQRNEKAIENAKEKIKRYESYIHDLKNGNYPSSTVKQERQELIFRIREQEDLLNILQGENDD